MVVPEPSRALIRLLRRAHSGELAAALAYRGHARSLPEGPDRRTIERIEREELEHRRDVGRMLRELQSEPSRGREALFWLIGQAVRAACHASGWFAPMYGAGRLEAGNIAEYEEAARLARECGLHRFAARLSVMADVEAEHERFFRGRVMSHWLSRWVPLWASPPGESSARVRVERFAGQSVQSLQ